MSVQIAIDQDRPGPSVSAGTPGQARNDLWLSRVVRPRSVTTAAGYAWTLLDKPAGSTAVITSDTLQACAFTPDLPGSYRLRLVVNGGGLGNTQIVIAAVRYDTAGFLTNRGWRIPAFGEGVSEDNFAGQMRGWAEAFDYIFNEVRVSLDAALNPAATITFVSTIVSSGSNTFARVGARFIDLSAFPLTIGPKTRLVKFVADMDKTAGATSVQVRLFDATHAVAITGADVTSTSIANDEQVSTGLTVGAAAGNVRNDVVSNYEVQLRMNGGTPNVDQVFLTNARLVITYA